MNTYRYCPLLLAAATSRDAGIAGVNEQDLWCVGRKCARALYNTDSNQFFCADALAKTAGNRLIAPAVDMG